jgi:hypothetical protein
MTLKKVSFGTTKIQKLRRVALDQNLLETLGLGIGDLVRIELDTEHEAVLITRAIEARPELVGTPMPPRRSRAKR